jgi:hypothetical protein
MIEKLCGQVCGPFFGRLGLCTKLGPLLCVLRDVEELYFPILRILSGAIFPARKIQIHPPYMVGINFLTVSSIPHRVVQKMQAASSLRCSAR